MAFGQPSANLWPFWSGAACLVGGGLYGRGRPLWSGAAFIVGGGLYGRGRHGWGGLYGWGRPLRSGADSGAGRCPYTKVFTLQLWPTKALRLITGRCCPTAWPWTLSSNFGHGWSWVWPRLITSRRFWVDISKDLGALEFPNYPFIFFVKES